MPAQNNNKQNDSINCVLVIGLGRIGLPQALTFANSGIKVYGYDRDAKATQALKNGQAPFYEPFMGKMLNNAVNKNFFPISSIPDLHKVLPEIDAIIFTIGTNSPSEQDALDKKQLDFSAYFILLDQLFSNKTVETDRMVLKKGIKLIVRTTLPLGGTDKLKNYVETKYSLKEGKDVYFAFVPERITEGAAIEELKNVPKIIGVYSDAAYEPIKKLFENAGAKAIRVKNPITAEFCKLTDNSFRSTLFSYANEISMYASEFDVNVEEVIQTVNDNYERNHIPLPGFVSGYCLSKDPYIFELDFSKDKGKRDFQSLWYYGRKTNDYLVNFVAQKVVEKLKNPGQAKVAILGLAFKEDVDDFRMSHSLKMIETLIKMNVNQFKLYDPYLDTNKYSTLPDEFSSYIVQKSNTLDANFLSDADAIIICGRHKSLRTLNTLAKLTELLQYTQKPCYLFDGWNIWKEAIKIKHIKYEGMGFRENNFS